MSMHPYGHPFMRSGNWYDWPTPGRIFDQSFGTGFAHADPVLREMEDSMASHMGMMQHRQPMSPMGSMPPPYWMRPASVPRVDAAKAPETGTSEVQCDKDKFEVRLDVRHFKPEELTVKTVENTLSIEGKHEEKMDEHGFIERHFVRKYVLPKGVEPDHLTSALSPEGVLTCKAPMKSLDAPGERTVPIAAGPPLAAVRDKDEAKM